MTKMTRIAILPAILAVIAVGCARGEKKASPSPAPVATTLDQPLKPVFDMEKRPGSSNIVVEVDGTKLTRGEADIEVDARLAGIKTRVPPEQLEFERQRELGNVVQQFIVRTMLLNEADRMKIEATEEDKKKAYDEIRSSLPAGMTLEQAMTNSPLGEARMREEIVTRIKVSKLLASQATNDTEATEEEVAAFRKTIPETVRARHVLVRTDAADDAKAREEKKKKAEAIRQQLVKGADFAETAKQFSDCPTKQAGGDVGQFSRDAKIAKPFLDASFSQEVNAIGPVVETEFGYHIIQVTERNKAGEAPSDKVAEILKRKKQQQAASRYLDKLAEKAQIRFPEMEAQGAPPLLRMPRPPQPSTPPPQPR